VVVSMVPPQPVTAVMAESTQLEKSRSTAAASVYLLCEAEFRRVEAGMLLCEDSFGRYDLEDLF